MLEDFRIEIGDPDPWDRSHAANIARRSLGTTAVWTAVGRWNGTKVRNKGNVTKEILQDPLIDLAEIVQRKMIHWCENNLPKGA